MNRRWSHAAIVAGAVALIAPIPIAAAGSSVVNSQWAGTAAADGMRVSVVIDGFLFVDNVVDAGGPTAQAAAGSFSGSRALAAYPYPGEIVMTAHGQTSGAAPNYPLVAQSNNGGPSHSEMHQGAYDVKADSSDDASAAVAQAAVDGGAAAAGTTRSQAHVVHDTKTGTVSSAAESTAEGFSVAGVFSIGRVHSYAQITSPAGTKKPASDTEFGDVRIGGQEVGVTNKGLVLAGTNTPLPPDSTANALLSSAGITVHYVAGTTSATSVVAPALVVSAVQDVPTVGETTVTYVLGQASVSAQAPGSVGGTTSLGPSMTGASTDTGVASTAPGTPTSAAAAGPGLVGTAGTAGTSPQTAPAPGTPGGPGYQLAAEAGPSSQSLYLVVAAGAIVLVGAALLFRMLAVKLAWT